MLFPNTHFIIIKGQRIIDMYHSSEISYLSYVEKAPQACQKGPSGIRRKQDFGENRYKSDIK